MAHDALFADAARPARVVILSLLLRDYSIGHEILLWQRRNPLVTLIETDFAQLPECDRRAALIEAVLICYRTWAQNHKPEKNLRLWGIFALGNPILATRYRSLIPSPRPQPDWAVQTVGFRDYRAMGTLDLPTVPMPRVPGAPYHYFGSPSAVRLLHFLTKFNTSNFGLGNLESLYDFPFGLAQMLYRAEHEASGSLWIENEHDAAAKRSLAAYEQKHPESTLAIGTEAVQKLTEQWNRDHPETPAPLMRAATKN